MKVAKEPFCPLYASVAANAPHNSGKSANAGLLFDKFGYAWRISIRRERDKQPYPEFDKGTGHDKAGANNWLNSFAREVGCQQTLTEACDRQRRLLEKLGGQTLLLTNTSRFVTGMGRQHPIENGFAWHPTLGVTYLPGSSVKGMLRAWLREEEGDIDAEKKRYIENSEIKAQFGLQERHDSHVGQYIFFDMLPTKPPQLVVDVMTPHYGPYYQDGDIPGDWHNPVPITFLTVEVNTTWQVGMAPRFTKDKINEEAVSRLVSELEAAFEWFGAGAKTAVGYGRFARDTDAEKQWHQEQQRQRAEREHAARQAAEHAAFEASLANDSAQLRQLKILRKQQNWQLTAGDQNMTAALNDFADNTPAPPQDCLDWIRELLESISTYKGVWTNPNHKTGKKKNNSKYPANAIRQIVIKLNPGEE